MTETSNFSSAVVVAAAASLMDSGAETGGPVLPSGEEGEKRFRSEQGAGESARLGLTRGCEATGVARREPGGEHGDTSPTRLLSGRAAAPAPMVEGLHPLR